MRTVQHAAYLEGMRAGRVEERERIIAYLTGVADRDADKVGLAKAERPPDPRLVEYYATSATRIRDMIYQLEKKMHRRRAMPKRSNDRR